MSIFQWMPPGICIEGEKMPGRLCSGDEETKKYL